MTSAAVWNEVETLFHEMEVSIDRMVEQSLRFDHGYRGREGVLGREDLESEAKMAIYDGLQRYCVVKDAEARAMKIKTFAYWFLLKRLYGAVDVNRVVYDVYDASGRYLATFPARAYYQKKSTLPDHTFKSRRLDVDIEASGERENWIDNISSD